MIIKSISGKVLLKSSYRTMKSTLEYAVERELDLSFADFRRAKLTCAMLDGLKAQGASFWGADLTGADLGLADLRGADFRSAELKDVCMAESDLSGADFRGAYFSGTLVEGTILDSVRVSCPSFLDCDLQAAGSTKGLVLSYRGEIDISLENPPLVIRGLQKNLVILGPYYMWGNGLYRAGFLPVDLQKALFTLKTVSDLGVKPSFSRNAKRSMLKILSHPARI